MLAEYLKDLAQLVNLDAGTGNYAGVTRAAEIMLDHYRQIGFETQLVDLGPNAGRGLLAVNKPGAERYDVLLNAHLDTVFPDGTAAQRPFRIEGDRAFGPGVSDCKSGVLAIFYALRMADPADLERLSIAVAMNPDEETGSLNSGAWLDQLAARSKRALIFEAARAGGELVRSRKGSSVYEVRFKGLASHAGAAPYQGANANLAAARLALAAWDLADYHRGTTVNPGIISGGTAANVISAEAFVKLDTRYWNNEDDEGLHKAVMTLSDQTWAPRVTQEITRVSHISAMPYSESTKELVEQISRAGREVGFEPAWVDAGGASDGNHIASLGIPVIDGCGPAGGGFHSDSEFLLLDTVEERIRMVAKFLSLI